MLGPRLSIGNGVIQVSQNAGSGGDGGVRKALPWLFVFALSTLLVVACSQPAATPTVVLTPGSQPFFLLITEPEDQSVVSQPNIRVSGSTSQDSTVKVNGVTIKIDGQGNFSTSVTLRPGANTIIVEAVNGTKETLNIPVAVILKP